LVSFSQTSGSGSPPPASLIVPSAGSAATMRPSRASSDGRAIAGSHDQRLRNQRVGSRWSVASSGPAFRAVTRMQMSSGPAFA
jgi:hypothetical protein